jgi:hypothetical protein
VYSDSQIQFEKSKNYYPDTSGLNYSVDPSSMTLNVASATANAWQSWYVELDISVVNDIFY